MSNTSSNSDNHDNIQSNLEFLHKVDQLFELVKEMQEKNYHGLSEKEIESRQSALRTILDQAVLLPYTIPSKILNCIQKAGTYDITKWGFEYESGDDNDHDDVVFMGMKSRGL